MNTKVIKIICFVALIAIMGFNTQLVTNNSNNSNLTVNSIIKTVQAGGENDDSSDKNDNLTWDDVRYAKYYINTWGGRTSSYEDYQERQKYLSNDPAGVPSITTLKTVGDKLDLYGDPEHDQQGKVINQCDGQPNKC